MSASGTPARFEPNYRKRTGQAVIERPRVMRRLLEAAEYPIILINAPAGFGKTTSIKQFLARCENPILVSTPASASTLGPFIQAFAQGCGTVIPAMTSPPSELSDQPLSSEQELELHTAWAIANLRTVSCTIAIDDLQHADSDPRVADFLSRLSDCCGDQIQWIFASRTQGFLPRVRWQAYARADSTITADDLRMDQDEAYELATSLDSPVTREQLKAWVTLTQGFPIPLTFAIRASSRRGNVDKLTDGMRTLTFHFLAEHLWQALPSNDRALLELAAFLPPTHIYEYIHFGIERASARISALSDDIAFVSLDSASLFSMHDLFRDFVHQQVFTRGIAANREVALNAAAFLQNAGRTLDALEILADVGDISLLLSTIETSFNSDNLEITPRLAAAIERESLGNINLGALLLQTNYWTRRGSATKALCYAEEILKRPHAKSHQLLCAIRTISRFTHHQPSSDQRAWLDRLPAIIERLDKPDYSQAFAYNANYCARFPELIGEAKRLVDVALQDVRSLDLRNRFDMLMVSTITFMQLDDEESAMRLSHEAVDAAQALNDPNELAKALNALGAILYKRCDPEFEAISEQLRKIVVTYGAWRFCQTSHWIPAEYYARCGDAARSLEASGLFDDVIFADEAHSQFRAYWPRIITILTNLIDESYSAVLADFAKFGLPELIGGKYEVALSASLSHGFLGDDIRASQRLSEARTFRERMTSSWQRAAVFDVFYGEVIALCSIGRWTQAKRLICQFGERSAGAPGLYNALTLLTDGPPFAGVASALQPFIGMPYVGMLALLANRVVKKWSLPRTERLLTTAEADVLRLISLGKSNKDIASTRSRSVETVKRQVASVYRKLGVENRTSAVNVGRERGLL